MKELNNIVFYRIDRAMRSYRQMAQRRFKERGIDVTVDQWMVLKSLKEDPSITQMELAQQVFRDNASVTRMINLLVEKSYLTRQAHPKDRRRYSLHVTELAEEVLRDMEPIILTNRAEALKGVTLEDIERVKSIMDNIARNCNDSNE